MSALLLEIVNVYPALAPASLSAHASNRVCNALALLQCVASHAETRQLFLNGESRIYDMTMIAPLLTPQPTSHSSFILSSIRHQKPDRLNISASLHSVSLARWSNRTKTPMSSISSCRPKSFPFVYASWRQDRNFPRR